MQMVLKCADIGHLAVDPITHKRWAFQLEEEFFRQVHHPFNPVCQSVCCCLFACFLSVCLCLSKDDFELPVCLYAWQSICPHAWLCICLFAWPSIHLYVWPSICLLVCLSACPACLLASLMVHFGLLMGTEATVMHALCSLSFIPMQAH